jgi:hypothetical protein
LKASSARYASAKAKAFDAAASTVLKEEEADYGSLTRWNGLCAKLALLKDTSCSITFTSSAPEGHVKSNITECTEALSYIEQSNHNPPDRYISRVTIKKGLGIFQRGHLSADVLSHNQFQSLLECVIDATEKTELPKCVETCLAIPDKINLNFMDDPRYGTE